MDLKLKDKVVIVTGASQGIGVGICRVFAQEGAKVVVNYRSKPERSEQFAKDLAEEFGVETLAVKADVSKEDEVKELFRAVDARFGDINVLVNNAGVQGNDDFQDITLETWNKYMETNVNGIFLTCREFARYLIPKGEGGRIVNVLSKAAVSSNSTGVVHYNASKSAGLMLTKSFSKEMSKYNIYANAVLPGYIDTEGAVQGMDEEQLKAWKRRGPESPAHRFQTPEDVGYTVAFLASELSHTTIGSIVDITGGMLL